MFLRISFVVLFFLCLSAHGGQPHQTELKYLVPDLGKLPKPVLTALKNGGSHPDILRKGLVIQEYLHVTNKNILELTRAIERDIGFVTSLSSEQLLSPGNIQEIRFMRKFYQEDDQFHEHYQVTLLGGADLSRLRLETPGVLTEKQQLAIQQLFSRYSDRVRSEIRKLFFEIVARDQQGTLLLDEQQQPRPVQVDLFFSCHHGRFTPEFIDGEVVFAEIDQQQAIRAASAFSRDISLKPGYLGQDITSLQRVKTRNIADFGTPSFITRAMEPFADTNDYYLTRFIAQFRTWVPSDYFQESTRPSLWPRGLHTQQKVLINAEPFGFGPSSAIAEFFPYLRSRISHLSYIGTGHTLDLQKRLPYDSIHDYGAESADTRRRQFGDIAKQYDVFITASDFEAASWAKALGLKVVIYDPLTWYWPEIPPVVQQADLYIAQNFFGVSERLRQQPKRFPSETRIVPPVISRLYESHETGKESLLLVNFGGLSNPYMSQDAFRQYVTQIIQGIDEALAEKYDRVHFLGGKKMAEAVNGLCDACKITTVQPQQVQQLFASASLVILTSGLGNIYEAATMGKPVLWLPPANDSQGQQIKILAKHDMVDIAIDWHDLLPDTEPVDYFAPQPTVLAQITQRMKQASQDRQATERLQQLARQASELSRTDREPAISALLQTFSYNGAKAVAENILQWLHDNSSGDQ